MEDGVNYLRSEYDGNTITTYYRVTFPRKYPGIRNIFRGRTLTVKRTYDTEKYGANMFIGSFELNNHEYEWVKEMSRPPLLRPMQPSDLEARV